MVASGCRRFDDAFAATTAGRLGPVACGRLEGLLSRPKVLAGLKSDPGPLGLDTLLAEIGKLSTVRALGLDEAVFGGASDRIVAAWRARAARMYPSDFGDCPEPVRYALLGGAVLDPAGRARRQPGGAADRADPPDQRPCRTAGGEGADRRAGERAGQARQFSPGSSTPPSRIPTTQCGMRCTRWCRAGCHWPPPPSRPPRPDGLPPTSSCSRPRRRSTAPGCPGQCSRRSGRSKAQTASTRARPPPALLARCSFCRQPGPSGASRHPGLPGRLTSSTPSTRSRPPPGIYPRPAVRPQRACPVRFSHTTTPTGTSPKSSRSPSSTRKRTAARRRQTVPSATPGRSVAFRPPCAPVPAARVRGRRGWQRQPPRRRRRVAYCRAPHPLRPHHPERGDVVPVIRQHPGWAASQARRLGRGRERWLGGRCG